MRCEINIAQENSEINRIKKLNELTDRYLREQQNKKFFLDDDEEVIFGYVSTENVLSDTLRELTIGAIFGISILIALLFSLALIFTSTIDLFTLVFIIILFSSLSLVIAPYIIRGLKGYAKITRNLPYKVLKNYEHFEFMTTKRWIQKSYLVLNFNPQEFQHNSNLQILNDVFSVNIDNIYMIYKRKKFGILELIFRLRTELYDEIVYKMETPASDFDYFLNLLKRKLSVTTLNQKYKWGNFTFQKLKG